MLTKQGWLPGNDLLKAQVKLNEAELMLQKAENREGFGRDESLPGNRD